MRKKLIEVALPLEAINAASAREKSIRHGHPSTLHLWWARRPLAAARAVIFTSLVDDPDDPNAPPDFVEACRKLRKGANASVADTPRQRLFDFIETLVQWESTTDEDVLETARELIRLSTEGNPPPLLDPFAGGGSIPLEAQRLGLEAHASDLNPVAVMINKALIEIPPCFANRPPVFSHCLVSDTLIFTPRGFVPIEDIQTGDEVLTHRGCFTRVTRTYRCDYDGLMYRLKAAHVSQPLLITPEHPIYGIRTGKCGIGYAAYCHLNCAWMAQNDTCSRSVSHEYQLDWIEAQDVERYDLIFMPTLQETAILVDFSLAELLPAHAYLQEGATLHYQKATSVSLARRDQFGDPARQYQIADSVPITPELCRLIGYFAAEGYARVKHDGGTVQFTFHADETHLHEDVIRLMETCFGIQAGKTTDNRPNNNQSIRLNFYSKPIAEVLRQWCYTDDGYKCLPRWALSLPDDMLAELLRGYWSGDGSRSNNDYQCITSSPHLAGQLRLILQRLGVISRLHTRTVKPTRVNGKVVRARGLQYSIHVTGQSLVDLAALVGRPKREELNKKRGGQHGHWWTNGYLLPIRGKTEIDYSGPVYNLETEEHSFITAAGCVHSCSRV